MFMQNLQKLLLLSGLVLASAVTSWAVERELRLESPVAVPADQQLVVTVSASTDAGHGEQVGFLHVESSADGGKTWTGICYVDHVGPKVSYKLKPAKAKAGSTIIVRARAAFRDGLAGDVDFQGGAILWNESWEHWASPPARQASIKVTAP